MKLNFVEQHIIDCIRAAVIEADGDLGKAARMRSQGKLRLVCMSEEEIWELAGRTSCPPGRSVEEAYRDIKQTVAEYKASTGGWLNQTYGRISTGSSM